MPYSSEKLRWRGDFFRANGRWPSTAEMHSAFDDSVPETSPDVPGDSPGTVPEDSPEVPEATFPEEDAPEPEERSPGTSNVRWNIWTGFL